MPDTTVIKLDNLESIMDMMPTVLGQPAVVHEDGINGIRFNGVGDGLILPGNPLQGLDQFTVQVLFKPDFDGLPEQRFIHFQDTSLNRVLIETRVNNNHTWYFDTFLYQNEPDSRLTLIDEDKTHSTDQWFWGALSYDGEVMRHFINGAEELSGLVQFGLMGPGEISVGVRLNRVHWFKGVISEIRIDPRSLRIVELEQIADYDLEHFRN